MKSARLFALSVIISIAAFLSTSPLALAENLQAFFGKYRAVEGDCVKFSGPFRAYVGMDSNHIDLLIREFPSGDASQTTIHMRSGKMPAPGIDPAEFKKGTYVQVATTLNGSVLRSQSVFVKLGKQSGFEVMTLDAGQPGFLVRTETISYQRPSYCKYQRIQ